MSFPNKRHDWNQTLTRRNVDSDDDGRHLHGSTHPLPTANKKQRVAAVPAPPPQMEMPMQLYGADTGPIGCVNHGHAVPFQSNNRSLRHIVWQKPPAAESSSKPHSYSHHFSTQAIEHRTPCMSVAMTPTPHRIIPCPEATSYRGSCFDASLTPFFDHRSDLHRFISVADTSSVDPAFMASLMSTLQSPSPPTSVPLLPGLLSHPVSQYLSMRALQRHQLQQHEGLVFPPPPPHIHHPNNSRSCGRSTFPVTNGYMAYQNGTPLVGQKRSLEHSSELTAPVTHVQHQWTSVPTALPALLSCPTDQLRLTPLQALLREQVEVFEAQQEDASTHIRGRNKVIKLGQVGIRCRHCCHIPIIHRSKGSTYYPTSVWGLYQASQNMCQVHLVSGLCTQMPPRLHAEFTELIQTHRSATGSSPTSGAGRSYWAGAAHEMGLVDTNDGIYFIRNLPYNAQFPSLEPDSPGAYRKTKPKETK